MTDKEMRQRLLTRPELQSKYAALTELRRQNCLCESSSLPTMHERHANELKREKDTFELHKIPEYAVAAERRKSERRALEDVWQKDRDREVELLDELTAALGGDAKVTF